MKMFLLTLLAVPLLANASNWVLTDKNVDGDSFFIDTKSITRSGDSVTFWVRTNYVTRSPTGTLSTKTNDTVNCRTRETITRHYMTYDDLNNLGKLIQSFPAVTPKWEPIAPDSINEVLMKFVCKRR
jgi:hypothetical protein